MSQDQWYRLRSGSALVQHMKRHPVDFTSQLGPAIHGRLVLAPAVAVAPMFGEFAQVSAGYAVFPFVCAGRLVGPDRGAQPLVELRQPFVRDLYSERFQCHPRFQRTSGTTGATPGGGRKSSNPARSWT